VLGRLEIQYKEIKFKPTKKKHSILSSAEEEAYSDKHQNTGHLIN
jgi:hypothetical protein